MERAFFGGIREEAESGAAVLVGGAKVERFEGSAGYGCIAGGGGLDRKWDYGTGVCRGGGDVACVIIGRLRMC